MTVTFFGGWADVACPDCDAAPGEICHWWCPRYADDPGEVPDGDA